jgi:adenylate kinase
MNLVLLGPPGAGKGTQAALLTEEWGIPRISSGEILREVAQRAGETGRRVAALIDQGHMVPDELIQSLIWERLEQPDAQAGFILDGFPRTVAQAEALDRFLREHGRALTAVLNLVVDEEELTRRLSGRWVCPVCQRSYHLVSRPPQQDGVCDVEGARLEQRADDRPEAIRERLTLYHQRTEPVLEYYRQRSLLRPIRGEQSMAEVSRQIRDVLEAEAAWTPPPAGTQTGAEQWQAADSGQKQDLDASGNSQPGPHPASWRASSS